jgi:hypothetical protein
MVTTMAKFQLGQVVATPGALDAIDPLTVALLLRRHSEGDWGDIDPEDAQLNNEAIASEINDTHGATDEDHRDRVMSVYKVGQTIKIWVITEYDRSVTTLLLPSEY